MSRPLFRADDAGEPARPRFKRRLLLCVIFELVVDPDDALLGMAQDGVDHLVHLAGFRHEGGGGTPEIVGGEACDAQDGQTVLRLVALQRLAERVPLDRFVLGAVRGGEDVAGILLVLENVAGFLVLLDGLLYDLPCQGGEGDPVRLAVLGPFVGNGPPDAVYLACVHSGHFARALGGHQDQLDRPGDFAGYHGSGFEPVPDDLQLVGIQRPLLEPERRGHVDAGTG